MEVAFNVGMNQTALSPTDLLAQLQALQAQVAVLTESHAERDARQLREALATEARLKANIAQRRLDSEPAKERALDWAGKRAPLAARCDKAAADLIAALTAMRSASRPIAEAAGAVITARIDAGAVGAQAGQLVPLAAGDSAAFAAAAARVVRSIVDAIGRDSMQELVIANAFADLGDHTFVSADRDALAALGARL